MDKRDVYQSVTDRIVAALEAGTVPWKKPWRSAGGYPVNVRNGRQYRGINILLLMLQGYDDPRWGTFGAMQDEAAAQAKREGREIVIEQSKRGKQAWEIVDGKKVWFRGGVSKGEQGTRIVLWKPVKKKEANGEDSQYMLLRDYVVFNAKQTEGLPELEVEEEREFTPIQQAESIVLDYIWAEGCGDAPGPPVMYGYDGASYSPSQDIVKMPEPKQFISDEAFYVTLFHELIHSTGHDKRLKRIVPALFGTDPYAKEELVAEIGASFLAGIAELETAGGEESASYLAGWLSRIKDDPRLIVQAAAQAQKAADLIVGRTFEEKEEKQELAATAA